jgi:hypothetical protein
LRCHLNRRETNPKGAICGSFGFRLGDGLQSVDNQLKGDDGIGFVEAGFVHFGRDGVGRLKLGVSGEHKHAGRIGRKPCFLAAERQDDGHPIVDVSDCFVGFGRQDGEVDCVLFGRIEFSRLA